MINIILVLLVVYLFAYIDYEHWMDNDYIESHKSRFYLRAIVIFGFSLRQFPDITMILINFTGMTLIFASLFDNVLNKLKGFDLFFLGTTPTWDRFWAKHFTLYLIMIPTALVMGLFLLIFSDILYFYGR